MASTFKVGTAGCYGWSPSSSFLARSGLRGVYTSNFVLYFNGLLSEALWSTSLILSL